MRPWGVASIDAETAESAAAVARDMEEEVDTFPGFMAGDSMPDGRPPTPPPPPPPPGTGSTPRPLEVSPRFEESVERVRRPRLCASHSR